MKKKILLTFALALSLALLFAFTVFGVDIENNGLTYSLTQGENGADNTAKIKTHEGKTLTVTDIVIPEYVEYDGARYYVTEMAGYCFKNTNITTVRFDDNCRITLIPSSAFYNCNSLTLIDFGKAGITTIGHQAFAYSELLTFQDNRLPCRFSAFSGAEHFDNCNAMYTLVFPETFTEFDTDTRIQSSNIVNLVFEGKMTKVFLQYNKKHNSGGMNVYLTKNSSSELNGSIVETTIYNNAPYYKNVKDAYTVKTDGSLTVKWSSNDANSNGTSSTTIDGLKYNCINTNQDKIYFCGDDSVSFIVRTYVPSGSWTTGYVATYKTNSLDPSGATNANVTYKMASPHFLKETINQDANCLYPASRTEVCYCGDVITREVLGTELGDHTYVDDFDCTTEHVCSVCLETVIEALSHDLLTSVVYERYDAKGIKTVTCANKGCSHSVTEDMSALFACLGYSAPENGKGGIAIGFTVNNVAIAEYKEVTGKTVKYGVFAVAKDRLGNNDVFAEDGTAAKGVINAEMTNYEFVAFEIKIVGFTDERKDTKLAMGAYVAVTDGETTEYSYMQGGTPDENEKYCFVSYNDIVNAPSTNEDTAQ